MVCSCEQNGFDGCDGKPGAIAGPVPESRCGPDIGGAGPGNRGAQAEAGGHASIVSLRSDRFLGPFVEDLRPTGISRKGENSPGGGESGMAQKSQQLRRKWLVIATKRAFICATQVGLVLCAWAVAARAPGIGI